MEYRGGGEDDELAAGGVLDEGQDGLELAEVARLHHAVGFVDHQKLETRAIAQERVTLRTHWLVSCRAMLRVSCCVCHVCGADIPR